VPLTNHAGWALVALLMIAALDHAVPVRDPPDPDQDQDRHEGVIAVLLGWTWLGSTLANAAFFGRPAVASWGGLALGVPVALYLRAYLHQDLRLHLRQELRERWPSSRPSRVEP
jgi:putative membrane protein